MVDPIDFRRVFFETAAARVSNLHVIIVMFYRFIGEMASFQLFTFSTWIVFLFLKSQAYIFLIVSRFDSFCLNVVLTPSSQLILDPQLPKKWKGRAHEDRKKDAQKRFSKPELNNSNVFETPSFCVQEVHNN